jgi:hypothetical protein
MTKCPHCGGSLEQETELVKVQWFDAFWQLYPRHVGKLAASKAWKKAATSEAIKDEIMAALKCQLAGMMRQDKSFIPHASTWLNGRRFEDEYQHGAGGYGQIQIPRSIACEICGDTGINMQRGRGPFVRCSCARGSAPGLVIPQAEADDPAPF